MYSLHFILIKIQNKHILIIKLIETDINTMDPALNAMKNAFALIIICLILLSTIFIANLLEEKYETDPLIYFKIIIGLIFLFVTMRPTN